MDERTSPYSYDVKKSGRKTLRLAVSGIAGFAFSATTAAAAVTAFTTPAAEQPAFASQDQATATQPTSDSQPPARPSEIQSVPAAELFHKLSVQPLSSVAPIAPVEAQPQPSPFTQQLDQNQAMPSFGNTSSATPSGTVGTGSTSRVGGGQREGRGEYHGEENHQERHDDGRDDD